MSKKNGLPKSFEDRLTYSQLSEEEKAEIRTRAIEQVAKERRAAEEERFFQLALNEARLDGEEMEPHRRAALEEEEVFVDLPGHAVHIMLDGVEYLHGFTYKVSGLVGQTMREIMQRAWNHEEEVGGANRHWYQKPRHLKLTRHSQKMTTTQILGV